MDDGLYRKAVTIPNCRQRVGQGLSQDTRDAGAQAGVGARWCISGSEYIMAADPWSLNLDRKLLLGVKVRWQCARVKESRNHIGIGVVQQRGQSIPELREPPYPSLEIRSVLYFFVVIVVGNKATWQVTK